MELVAHIRASALRTCYGSGKYLARHDGQSCSRRRLGKTTGTGSCSRVSISAKAGIEKLGDTHWKPVISPQEMANQASAV
jgi:hypothetical protein